MKATAYEKGKMKKMYAPNKKVKIWIYIVSFFWYCCICYQSM